MSLAKAAGWVRVPDPVTREDCLQDISRLSLCAARNAGGDRPVSQAAVTAPLIFPGQSALAEGGGPSIRSPRCALGSLPPPFLSAGGLSAGADSGQGLQANRKQQVSL